MRRFPLAALAVAAAGCAGTPPADPTEVLDVVQSSQRALFERGDFAAYIAAFAPDCEVVCGRGPTAADTDVVYRGERFRQSRQLRFDGFPARDGKVTFEQPEVTCAGDTATVRHLEVLRFEGTVEEMHDVYELRRGAQGWKIARMRYWPKTAFGESYDARRWSALDAQLANARRQKDAAREVDALLYSLRFPELWEAAKRWTAAEPDNTYAWLWRAHGGALAGEAEDAVQAFAKVRALDAKAPIPAYAEARLAGRR